MSDKISALTEKTTIDNDDLFVIVDSVATDNKKVKASTVKAFQNGWVKYSFNYADFQPGAGPSVQLEVGTDIIPAGGLVTGVKVKHSASFIGGPITLAQTTFQADYTGPGNFFTGSNDVFTAPGAQKGKEFTGITTPAGATIPSQAAASKFYITLTVDTAINDLTAGDVDVWVKVDTLPL